jgi:uncharacterized protein
VNDLHKAASYAADHATVISSRSPDHGPRHWHDVARVGYMLLEVSNRLGADADHYNPELIFLFAALHDTQRQDEYSDPDHGNRAEDLARKMRDKGVIVLDNSPFELLCYALGDHDRGSVSDDPTVAICWDADRLTLPRVGIQPKKTLMSSAPVKRDFDMCLGFAKFILQDRDLSWSEIAKLYEERFYGHAPA